MFESSWPHFMLFREGIWAAALTPMHADLSPDAQEMVLHCQDLLTRGCQGIVLFGTTGEGPSFSLVERLHLLEKLIQAGLDPEKIIVANGSSGIDDTVHLARAVKRHRCAGILIAPPCFFKQVPEEGVIAFYREIIQRTADPELKVLLYHIPQFTGVPITLHIAQALVKEFPHIVVGLKESEGNIALTKSLIRALPSFQVFVGAELLIIETVHAGGAGSICGLSNLYPELLCTLFHEGKKKNSPNPDQLNEIFKALKGASFIPAAKALMEEKRGAAWCAVRPPLVALDALQKKSLKRSL